MRTPSAFLISVAFVACSSAMARADTEPSHWVLALGLGGVISFETRAAEQGTMAMPTLMVELGRQFGVVYAAGQLLATAAWMRHGRAKAGVVVGLAMPLSHRWSIRLAGGGGYGALGDQLGPSASGPYLRAELRMIYRSRCAYQGPGCLDLEFGFGPMLDVDWLSYDTHQGAVPGRRLEPGLLGTTALRF